MNIKATIARLIAGLVRRRRRRPQVLRVSGRGRAFGPAGGGLRAVGLRRRWKPSRPFG
jgi:hypothetical protein